MSLLHTDYNLIDDKVTVGSLFASIPSNLTKKGRQRYAEKCLKFSEYNLKIIKSQMDRKIVQYERQLTNATIWRMAYDIATAEVSE
tara:strand:+ start:494 stop:751 length:258 start_codon:yes stop_codon:yes gene_type:complete